jgi:hypothetical protein
MLSFNLSGASATINAPTTAANVANITTTYST